MTQPERSGREYLEIVGTGGRAVIVGEGEHIEALEALLRQRGIPCTHLLGAHGREGLELDSADRAAAQEVLDSYKAARGS